MRTNCHKYLYTIFLRYSHQASTLYVVPSLSFKAANQQCRVEICSYQAVGKLLEMKPSWWILLTQIYPVEIFYFVLYI